MNVRARKPLDGVHHNLSEADAVVLDQFIRDEIAAEDDRLWCIHVSGMDEVHPAPDRATAQLWAAQFTVYHHRRNPSPHPYDPVMNFTVQEWPHAADRHAEGLAESIMANTWPVDPLTVNVQRVRDVVWQIYRAPTNERQRLRREALWARINAGIGVGALATFVVALILVAYALASR